MAAVSLDDFLAQRVTTPDPAFEAFVTGWAARVRQQEPARLARAAARGPLPPGVVEGPELADWTLALALAWATQPR